jgi:hypothetical protein
VQRGFAYRPEIDISQENFMKFRVIVAALGITLLSGSAPFIARPT